MQILSLFTITSQKISGDFFEAFRRAKEIPDHPVYLLESEILMFPVYLKKRKDIKVIGLLADETFIKY